MSILLQPLALTKKDLTVQQTNDTEPFEMSVCLQNPREEIRVPFYYGISHGGVPSGGHDKITSEFTTTLRDYQHKMKNNVLKVLKKDKCAILSSYVGAGKTVIAINIACQTKLKTLVVVNRILLLEQWKKSIIQFTTCQTVDVLTRKTTPEKAANDFAIINGQNISKIPEEILKGYGCVILDECHTLMSTGVGLKLLNVSPKYLLGLSATPYREDGFQQMLELYFGNGIVFTKLNRRHNVYTTMTRIPFATTKGYCGQIDFNKILDTLGKSKKRNEMITDTIAKAVATDGKCCLVLVKRVMHGNTLAKMLHSMDIPSQEMYGVSGKLNFTSNVLITTTSKAGVGFDCPRLNTLILAAPIKNYFIQYLGRVMRNPDGVPEVYDFVDDNFILQTHYKERVKVYEEHGGVVFTSEVKR